MYPHTSNWDFVLAMLTKGALHMRLHWLGKKELFFWPAGFLMRAMGGIAVDRKQSTGMFEKLSERFQQEEALTIAITPEGTRSYRPQWKTGFYQLATQANVPIVMVALDYSTKTVTMSDALHLSHNLEEDLKQIQAFYAGKRGKFPELEAPIAVRNFKTKANPNKRTQES